MKIRLADFIADFLWSKDVGQVFTVTGGGAMFLNDAFGKHKKLKCLYNHHEQACAIAAEGFFRASGKLPLVCVTTGPGGTNALTGVVGAYLDSIPMLVISGQVKYATTVESSGLPLRQLGDQEWKIVETVKDMTKYAVMVTDPRLIKYHLQKALFLAQNGRPGPVWLDIPINVQSSIIDTETLVSYDETENQDELPMPISADTISEVERLIEKASKPLIFAGSGVWLSRSTDLLRAFIDKSGIPLVTAWGSNDLIESSHPLHIGRPGTVGDRPGNFAVSNCDLLIVLGSRLNIRTISYNYQSFAKKAFKIVVDIDALELKKPTVKIDMPVCGDVSDFLTKLLKIVKPISAPKWIDYCQMLKSRFDVVEKEYYLTDSPINPYCFVRELSKRLDEDDVTACSNGTAVVTTLQAAVIKKGQKYFSNSGCASMGYGLPAAIGAAAATKKRVICIEGDGSLMMNIQELMTVSNNNLPLKIFVINNKGYHSIRQSQTAFFGQPLVGVGEESGDLAFFDLLYVAKAAGLPFFRIESLCKLDALLDEILSDDKPLICEVMTDKRQFFAPKLSSKQLSDGTIVSPSPEDMFPFLDELLVKELNNI